MLFSQLFNNDSYQMELHKLLLPKQKTDSFNCSSILVPSMLACYATMCGSIKEPKVKSNWEKNRGYTKLWTEKKKI